MKSFTFFTLELVYQVGTFAVGKGGDGISEADVGAGERLGRDVDGTRHEVGMVAGEESTGRSGGTRAKDLAEVGRFAEVDGGEYLQENEMWKPSRRICLSFGRPG